MSDSGPQPSFDEPADLPFRWGATTHPGNVRESNEDDYVADAHVFAVADGMGGHNAGEVASQIATTTLRERLGSGAANLGVAVAAVIEANASIFSAAYSNPDQRGMGTTLTGLAVIPPVNGQPMRLGLVNVGDSRTYLRRSGHLRRATIDHSYVQELLNTGHISEEEARNHPRRNIVTRALGIEPTVRVDSWLVPLVRGDRWVVCSDGLVDEVVDAEIDELLAANPDPQDAADALVAAALLNGGRDNVTVIVLDVTDGQDPPDEDGAAVPFDDWNDRPTSMIEADADTRELDRPIAMATTTAAGVVTTVDGAAVTRRSRLATVLFALAAGVIVTVLIAGVAALIANNNDLEPTPTTSTSTSTSSTSSTSSTTSSSTSTTTTSSPETLPSPSP
jgi:PPM family protein phosphatase